MTKEQEVIEYFKKQRDICLENAEICDDNNFDEEAICLRKQQYMYETVLNMLKEKDKEIEKLKKHNKDLLRKLRNRVKEVKKLNKYSLYKKEFKTLNEQLKNKDKIIDLMAEKMAFDYDINSIVDVYTYKRQIKQYFESKAEKE